MSYYSSAELEVDDLRRAVDELQAERDTARETNTRLNRKCQKQERAIVDAEKCINHLAKGNPWCGGNFGRALLATACQRKDEEIARLSAAVAEGERAHLADLKEIRCYKGGDRFDNGADFAAIHAFVKGRIEQLTPPAPSAPGPGE